MVGSGVGAIATGGGLALVAAVMIGVGLGTVSGLVPGLHANNMALLLAAGAERVPGPPALVAAAMLAAGVVHTFLDVVPATVLGVPDPSMAASALPAHRLVLAGRGGEVLRLSAIGSAGALAVAGVLAVPVTAVMTTAYPVVRATLPGLLALVATALVVTEQTWRRRLGGGLAVIASTALGAVTLDLSLSGPLAGDVLAPLFAGLFGVPVLLDALGGGTVPPQSGRTVTLAPRVLAGLGAIGAAAGAAVGYLPGVSSAVAATLALTVAPGRHGARGFVVVTSGANTANTAFATCALVAFGTPRTGVLVAVNRVADVPSVGVLATAVIVAGAAGLVLVVTVGDAYLRVVGRLDQRRLSAAVLGLLVVVAYALAGPTGVGVLGAAALVGQIPVSVGARRVHLMGVLMGPIALGL